jgi:prefoldin subunit 5
MMITSRAAMIAALALLVGAPVADAAKSKPRAKVRTLTGHVVTAPYEAGRKVVVPVLVDTRTAKRAKLAAPVGVLMLKKSKRVKVRGQRARIAPTLLRAGDELFARAKVTRRLRRAAYWRMPARVFRVTKRSATLGPVELMQLVGGFGTDLAGLETALTNLAKYVQAGFQKHGADINALRADLGALNTALGALGQRVGALEAGLPALEARLQQQIDGLAGDLDDLATQMAALQTQLGSLQTQLTALQAQVGTLQGDLTALQGDVAALEAAVTGLTADVAALETTMGVVCGAGSVLDPLC